MVRKHFLEEISSRNFKLYGKTTAIEYAKHSMENILQQALLNFITAGVFFPFFKNKFQEAQNTNCLDEIKVDSYQEKQLLC